MRFTVNKAPDFIFLTKRVDSKEAIKLGSNFFTLLFWPLNQNFAGKRIAHAITIIIIVVAITAENVSLLLQRFTHESYFLVDRVLADSPVTERSAVCAAAATRAQKHNNCNKALLCNINQDASTVNEYHFIFRVLYSLFLRHITAWLHTLCSQRVKGDTHTYTHTSWGSQGIIKDNGGTLHKRTRCGSSDTAGLRPLMCLHTVGGRAPEDSFPKQPRCESPGHTESTEGKSTL